MSGGRVEIEVVHWIDRDEIPVKVDGFQYGADEYHANWIAGGGWHVPDAAAYPALLDGNGVDAWIDTWAADEVWVFGGPYFGLWEASMAGPGAYFINGGVYGQYGTDRPFAIMGFSYERKLAEMLHNLGHRTENHMARVFGGWDIANPVTDWDRFAANAGQSSGVPGVGNVHFPANGQSDYDYGNPNPVLSAALDWASYPNLTGATTSVSAATWGGPDHQLEYLRFFFDLLPRAAGVQAQTGRVNNWWAYVFDWRSYDGSGQVRCDARRYCDGGVHSLGLAASMGRTGSTSVGANDLVLIAADAVPGQPGLFLYGPRGVQVPFGAGWRCVDAPVQRLPVVQTDLLGGASWSLDVTNPPQGSGTIEACSTWYFQFWFRDPLGSGFNLSDGLEVWFCP